MSKYSNKRERDESFETIQNFPKKKIKLKQEYVDEINHKTERVLENCHVKLKAAKEAKKNKEPDVQVKKEQLIEALDKAWNYFVDEANGNFDSFKQLGEIYFEANLRDQAEELFEKCNNLSSNNPEILSKLANISIKNAGSSGISYDELSKNIFKSIKLFKKVLEIDPENQDGINGLESAKAILNKVCDNIFEKCDEMYKEMRTEGNAAYKKTVKPKSKELIEEAKNNYYKLGVKIDKLCKATYKLFLHEDYQSIDKIIKFTSNWYATGSRLTQKNLYLKCINLDSNNIEAKFKLSMFLFHLTTIKNCSAEYKIEHLNKAKDLFNEILTIEKEQEKVLQDQKLILKASYQINKINQKLASLDYDFAEDNNQHFDGVDSDNMNLENDNVCELNNNSDISSNPGNENTELDSMADETVYNINTNNIEDLYSNCNTEITPVNILGDSKFNFGEEAEFEG